VKDYRASIEKLRRDASEAKLISDLATDMNKREMFARLHQHLSKLADEVEQAMKSSIARTLGIGIGGHIAWFQ
jgi:hypothetical protein